MHQTSCGVLRYRIINADGDAALSLPQNAIQNALLRTGVAVLGLLPGGRRAAEPRSVLVVRLGNLGDTVVALPTFHALRRRFADAHMALLTSPTTRGAPSAADVLADDPTFDDLFVYYEDEPRNPAFRRRLRQTVQDWGVDLAVVLPNNLAGLHNVAKHVAMLGLCGVRRVAGARLVRDGENATGQVPRLMSLVEPLGANGVEAFPWIRLSDANRDWARGMLGDHGGRSLVGIQCGAKRPANRWPPERFVAVGRRLMEGGHTRIFLTGGPDEADLVDPIAHAIGEGCVSLAGKTSVAQLAAIGERLDAFVSNDTGTMHVVAAMGTPVVAIFSARDQPHLWYPYGDGHVVLRDEIECSPCLEDVCPRDAVPECLNRIGVDEVVEASLRVLGVGQ